MDHVATIVGWEVYVGGNEMKMCDSVWYVDMKWCPFPPTKDMTMWKKGVRNFSKVTILAF